MCVHSLEIEGKTEQKLLKAFEDFRGLYSVYNYITGIMNIGVASILIIIWLEAMYSCDPAVQLITYHDTCTTV